MGIIPTKRSLDLRQHPLNLGRNSGLASRFGGHLPPPFPRTAASQWLGHTLCAGLLTPHRPRPQVSFSFPGRSRKAETCGRAFRRG